jgi:hypothetical protein
LHGDDYDHPTPPRRRWFQFGLRTLFVVVTVVAVWLGLIVKVVRDREWARWAIEESGGVFLDFTNANATIYREGEPNWHSSWISEMLGDNPAVFIGFPRAVDHDDLELSSYFPEAHIIGRAPG